ncbi:ATP-binding protein [Streptomyces phaeochromogenes]|uniref:AAA family ATPase n=1 Tax=Streptomyces phaeochromogenes TaxID=1923 RepID=UPI00225484FF|nr:AAA family ATPase [Streptomyces phaeochromogenes]MCX5598376.1 ATP-binding protein [Streptomyces phaeochromogenes]
MPRPTIYAPRGLPGAGKSTLARRLAAAGAAHVELDVIKHRVWPDCPRLYDPYTGPGRAVQAAFEAEIAGWLAAGRDVVADRTSLNIRGLHRLERLGARLVIYDLRDVPVADCVARDAARPPRDRIGGDAIRAMAGRWL